jgi:hypothetical protein
MNQKPEPKPPFQFDDTNLAQIPPAVWEAERVLAEFFEKRGPGFWVFGRVQKRER